MDSSSSESDMNDSSLTSSSRVIVYPVMLEKVVVLESAEDM